MPKIADSINAMQVIRDTDTMVVTLNAIDRSSEKVIRTDQIEWAKVHDQCQKFLMLYGTLGFLRDRNSSIQGVINKLDAYKVTFDETLLIGNLVKERAAQGKRLSSLEAETLAKHFSKKSKHTVSITQVIAKWATLEEDQKEKILASKEVIDMMTKAAKAPQEVEGVDFDDFI